MTLHRSYAAGLCLVNPASSRKKATSGGPDGGDDPFSPREAQFGNTASLEHRLKIGLARKAAEELRKVISNASYSLDNNLHIMQGFLFLL